MFNFVLRPAAAAVLALGMTSSGVFAQANSTDEVTVLDEVIVSATRYEQQLSDVLPSASVITREEIESSQAPTLIDLIQSEPGVEIGRNGGPGTVASIFMRGQASTNVAVFIDGIPVQRDSYGNLKLVDIPPSQIEKIEILRGNMSAVYGEAAVGGAIHIFTRAGTGTSGPTASASYGSRNTSDLNAGYNLNGEDFKLGFSVQRYATDGYSAMNSNQNPLVNPDNDGFERESIFLNGEKRVSRDLAIGFQANRIEGDVQYDGNPSWGYLSTDKLQSKQKSSDLTLYSRINLSSDWSSRIAITESDFENREFKNNILETYGNYEGDQIGLNWSNTYKIGPGNASFGVDMTDAKFETNSSIYKRESKGYYSGYSGRIDRLDYQANLRRDEVESKDATSVDEISANTWMLGAGYQLTDTFKMTGLISTAFRAPSPAELFGQYGNPELEPAEHSGYEIGGLYEFGNGALRLTYFDTNVKNDWISESGGGVSTPIGKTENKGVEVSLNGASNGIHYKFNVVSQDPRKISDNTRLLKRAKEYASLSLDSKAAGIKWGTNIIWSGSRTDVSNKSLKPYTVINLSAAKKLSPEWTAKLKLENAFDEQYQLAYGYDAVPRGIFVSLQYQPK